MEFLSSDQKTTIHGYIWKPVGEVKGIIQLIHGITEHMGRYEQFASYFNDLGYIVYGIDLIGHGRSLQDGMNKAYIGEKGSWQYLVKDVHTALNMMKSEYPNGSTYIIGFSLGSFVLHTLMLEEELKVDGCFLLGTGAQPTIILQMIYQLVSHEANKNGETNSTPLIENLAFETYNNKIKSHNTKADWLLKNKEALDEYLNDPFSQKEISAGLFRELLWGMILSNQKVTALMNYPIYLISGKEDPVGDLGKGVELAKKNLIKQGAKEIKIHLLDNMRHDILHEKEWLSVYQLIENYIK